MTAGDIVWVELKRKVNHLSIDALCQTNFAISFILTKCSLQLTLMLCFCEIRCCCIWTSSQYTEIAKTYFKDIVNLCRKQNEFQSHTLPSEADKRKIKPSHPYLYNTVKFNLTWFIYVSAYGKTCHMSPDKKN